MTTTLRFFRRFSLARWLRVNLSKRGASLSVGPRGASVTVNRDGLVTNVGLVAGLSVRSGRRWQ